MAISKSELDELVRQLNIEVILVPDNRSRRFASFDELNTFYKDELAFWRAGQVSQISARFAGLNQQLSNVGLANTIQDAQSRLQDFVQSERSARRMNVYSNTSFAQMLVSLQNSYPGAVNGALNYRSTDAIGPQSPPSFDGALVASLTLHPEFANLAVVADRAAFQKNAKDIDTCRENMRDSLASFKLQSGQWSETARRNFDAVRESAESQFQKAGEKATREFRDLRDEWSEKLAVAADEWKKKIEDLEATYAEKLKLEGPAKYWKDVEELYGKKGGIWVGASVGSALTLAAVAVGLLYHPAAVLLGPVAQAGKEPGFSLAGLRGTLLVALIVSVRVYIIHLFVKLATSAYHLQRDATERYQLTLVFLALTKDSTIEPEDRKIVLQSLFSRADTGLLKNEGGLSMPGLWDLIKPSKG